MIVGVDWATGRDRTVFAIVERAMFDLQKVQVMVNEVPYTPSYATNTSGPSGPMHHIDVAKGGCQICGIDAATIDRYNVACPGKANLPGGVEAQQVDMAALQKKYNDQFGLPPVVLNPPMPISWKPGMTDEDLAPLDKLLEAKKTIDAKIAARLPDPKLPPPVRTKALPPRIVE